MKKHNILLTGFILPLLCLSLQGCYCNPSDAIQTYNINLTQPDGSVPKSGWAMVYEKHLDPNTSYSSQRIPISDTMTWENHHEKSIRWTDNRETRNHAISIECFSPEELTHDALRYAWHSLEMNTPEIEIRFPQVRPLEMTIRSINPLPSNVQAWAIYISPLILPPGFIEGSTTTTTQFHAWTFANENPSKMETSIEFREHSTMYVHLFRLDEGIWHTNGTFTAALNEDSKEFSFYTNHTMLCCE